MNKVVLMGRLTKDPELRYTSNNNTAVCNFTLAVEKRVKQGEQKQSDFIICQAWQKSAEFISKYFQKGSMILVVGRLQNRSWDDNDGKKHYVTEVIVEEQYFAGDKRADGKPEQQNNPEQQSIPVDEDDELPF